MATNDTPLRGVLNYNVGLVYTMCKINVHWV